MKLLQTLFKKQPQHHYDVHISGRVQDVWFRSKARKIAKELKVKGFIKYEGPEKLYVEVEGRESAVRSFLDWCHQGPSLARVDTVDITKNDVKGYNRFSIL